MTDEKISFKIVTEDIVRKKIINLDGSKATSKWWHIRQYFEINCSYPPSMYNKHHKFVNELKKDIFLMNLSLQKLAQFSERKMT